MFVVRSCVAFHDVLGILVIIEYDLCIVFDFTGIIYVYVYSVWLVVIWGSVIHYCVAWKVIIVIGFVRINHAIRVVLYGVSVSVTKGECAVLFSPLWN